ncbi:cytochrome P450 [Stereum hirsutum FP-91666 SS1]|uniref:cytochrome P450 n=1 Tax=Stereum hirsutum (strain FP-91666) TaxID=721885 RepID=UPI0004449D86|nr:cytochrome P450 [Stereum hirsutum FP-91666 SS1]EIM85220.1 cytochrome P450 [Stereum hirsutum FP-91666 SS1]
MFPLPVTNWTVVHAALLISIVLVYRRLFVRRKSPLDPLPYPDEEPEWIWGHEKRVYDSPPGQAYLRWMKSVGHTYRICAALGAPDVLVLGDTLAISYILQEKIYDYRLKPLKTWKAKYFKQCLRLVLIVLDDLSQAVEDSDGEMGVNILSWTNRMTLNAIGRVRDSQAFLYDFESGKSREAQLILDTRRRSLTGIARYASFLTLMMLRRFPALNSLPVPALQAQSLVTATIKSVVAKEIIARSSSASDLRTRGKDLLSRLLVAHDEQHLSVEEMYEHISTFLVSGQETTSQTVAFSIYELSRHPEIQQRLREELDTSYPSSTGMSQSQQSYLHAVLKETLRMYPALLYMERVATKSDRIPLQTHISHGKDQPLQDIHVEKGQTVIIPIISLHRSDAIWGDGNVFRPERWLGTLPDEALRLPGWSNLLSFSDGPRSCPGMRMAHIGLSGQEISHRKQELRDSSQDFIQFAALGDR